MFTAENIRLATAVETSFYEKNLYPLQDDIFTMLQTDRFYLSGGTCLSRFYYYHRYSEDLDLSQLTEWAKYKVVPLDYEGTIIALSNSKIEGTALLKKNMSPAVMNQFAHGLIGDFISNARSS